MVVESLLSGRMTISLLFRSLQLLAMGYIMLFGELKKYDEVIRETKIQVEILSQWLGASLRGNSLEGSLN